MHLSHASRSNLRFRLRSRSSRNFERRREHDAFSKSRLLVLCTKRRSGLRESCRHLVKMKNPKKILCRLFLTITCTCRSSQRLLPRLVPPSESTLAGGESPTSPLALVQLESWRLRNASK